MQLSHSIFLPCLFLLAVPAACNGQGSDPEGSGGQGGHTTIEGAPCVFGDDADDANKCGDDVSFACTPELGEAGDSCDEDDDCGSGELCFVTLDEAETGTCHPIEAVCAALSTPGEGLDFGEACDPMAAQDPCAGECVPIGDGEGGECEETCRVGAESGCGEDASSDASVACAFFAYDLSDAGIEQGAGDVGVCAHFCNCNADCPGEQLCLSAPADAWDGICAGGIDATDSVPICADGVGGAGGGPG